MYYPGDDYIKKREWESLCGRDSKRLIDPIFIYALCEPDTGEIRYIGKTDALHVRLKSHRNEKGRTRKCRWLAHLKNSGKEPLIAILDAATAENWEEKERTWISAARMVGVDLTNHTDGGEGLTGLSVESRKRLSHLMKARMADPEFRARVFTQERSAKISKALVGKKKSREHVAKLRQNQPGRVLTAEHRAKIKANNRGHRFSPEEVAALRASNAGNKYGTGNRSRTGMHNKEEHNKKISEFMRGRPKTEEQRLKMSLAKKRWWERKKNDTQVPE